MGRSERLTRTAPFFRIHAILFCARSGRTSDPPFHGWNDKMATGGDNRSSSDVIGVLFGVEKLDGCRAVQTLFGRVRYQHASVPVVDGDITAALGQLLSRTWRCQAFAANCRGDSNRRMLLCNAADRLRCRECFATCFASRIIAKQRHTIGSNGDRCHPLATRSENGCRHLCRANPSHRSNSHRGRRVKSLTSTTRASRGLPDWRVARARRSRASKCSDYPRAVGRFKTVGRHEPRCQADSLATTAASPR